MKYHYFHRFFTYSVRRNACVARYGGGCHGVLEPSVQSGVKRSCASSDVCGRPIADKCSRVIRFEDTARRGVRLGRYICQRITQVS